MPSDGIVYHYGAVRLAVTGSGSLRMKLFSLDDVKSYSFPNLTLQTTTNKEATKLCNFKQQYAYLELKTTAIDERFEIDSITIFIKPSGSGFPQ